MDQKASNSQNFTPFLGTNDAETLGREVKNLYAKLGFIDPAVTRKNPKTSQDLKGLTGHPLENYFDLAEFRDFVLSEDDGRKQVRASAKKIAEIRKQAVELAISGASKEVIAGLKQFEQTTRITGNALEPFRQLKRDIERFDKDVEKGILRELTQYQQLIGQVTKQLDEAEFTGDTDFFKKLKADLPKVKLVLKRLGLNSSKITTEVIKEVEKSLEQLKSSIPKAQSSELLQAGYIKRRTDSILNTLSDIKPTEAIAQITEVEPVIKEYLTKVQLFI